VVSSRNQFVDYVLETMLHWASVNSRKMFGRYGLYRDELMFALITDDTLYFKTDECNVAQFEQAGSLPFVYHSKARVVQMSYWSAPAECLESPNEMCDWCNVAYAAALRSSKTTKKR
jgi:DNA transformation protein